jgi:purine-nucleoside phosphorylase
MVSNAVGGMNPFHSRGDIVIIADHINLMGDNPLVGPNDDAIGTRFPDMSEPYSRKLVELAEQVALDLKIKVHRGVFVGVAGPNLETRAEYRFLRGIGADTVGMSTVPEVLVARHMEMKVLGLSVVTDLCLPDALEPADHRVILKAAESAEPKLTSIVKEVLQRF